MDKLVIKGGNALRGTIKISGAKNAMLPLMTAALLTDDTLTLENAPNLADVNQLAELLTIMGAKITFKDGTMAITCADIKSTTAPYEIVRKMRASILVLCPLVAKFGEAKVSLPGGCAIGTRPVDLHIKGLEALGAQVEIVDGYIHASAPKGLQGADFTFEKVTVTGTENILMAAVLAKGRTRLYNAAYEPEVSDLANCLVSMGAKISGIGTTTLVIEGVEKLHAATHSVLPDRIETGTYAIAAAITGGELELTHTSVDLLPTFIQCLEKTGAKVTPTANGFVVAAGSKVKTCNIQTDPYPGFPTDLQAQFMALMTLANGESNIKETIFENRFMHVPELCRMGADITTNLRDANVKGVDKLTGAEVMATDLRASVSLVLAALAAQGSTTINRIYHLDRGYDNIDHKLAMCGAEVKRLREDNTPVL